MTDRETLWRPSIVALICLLAATEGCAKRPTHVRVPRPAALSAAQAAELSEQIRSVLKLSGENAEAAREAAAAFVAEDPAAAELARRVAADASDLDAARGLAAAYLGRKLYFSAFELYRDIQAKHPGDVGAALALAEIWDVWRDYSVARQQVERALAGAPESVAALELGGRIHLHAGRLDEALLAFNSALLFEPDNAAVLNNAGYAYLLQEKWVPARAYFERALALEPSILEAQNNLGVVLAHLGDHTGALRRFMAAGAPAAAHNNLGVVYLAQKRWVQAQEAFRQALAIEPGYAIAQLNLQEAVSHLRLPAVYTVSFGDRSTAPASVAFGGPRPAALERFFRKPLAETTASAVPAASSGLDAAAHELTASASYAQILLEPVPASSAARPVVTPALENPAVLAHAGRDFLERAQWEQARTVLERAVALDGAGSEARADLAAALAGLGDRDGALRQLALVEHSGAAAHNRLGLIYLDHGRFKEAQQEFKRAVAASPADAILAADLPDAASHLAPARVYTIQIAARRTPEQAAAAVESLTRSGLRAEIVRADLEDKGVWYRARLYGYTSWRTAVEVARRLVGGKLIGEYWITSESNRRSGS
jgi:Flp pilus assembly protein TadD